MKDHISMDTETTGLNPYGDDNLFSISISTCHMDYYFNFNTISDYRNAMPLREYVLDIGPLVDMMVEFKGTIFMHNAKFDMAFLEKAGLMLDKHNVHCTYAIARVINNDKMSYSLDALGREIGFPKDDTVKKCISKNKLYRWEAIEGKAKRNKIMYYDLVPFEMISKYACIDSNITYKLGMKQLSNTDVSLKRLMSNEKDLTKVLYCVEKTGVKVDNSYTKKALRYSLAQAEGKAMEFEELTGIPFQDARSVLEQAFIKLGLEYPITEKGNASFNSEALAVVHNPIADIIKEYRAYYKKAGTYFKNFLMLSDNQDVLHCNYKQAGTATGRLSCANPNLQNLNKTNDTGDHPVRRCFIPRDGFILAMLDYDQMEYRLMLDYAGQEDVINEVLGGLDVHAATAKLMGVPRETAKTINFMLLYGGGSKKLATSLKIGVRKASKLRKEYFDKLPKIHKFIKQVTLTAENRGYIRNWLGRKSHFKRDFCYKAPNYLIQGGCADIVKQAMLTCHEFLKDYKSRIILQVHDELVFEIHKTEQHLLPCLKAIMEKTYAHTHLPLTVGIEISELNWKDKKEIN